MLRPGAGGRTTIEQLTEPGEQLIPPPPGVLLLHRDCITVTIRLQVLQGSTPIPQRQPTARAAPLVRTQSRCVSVLNCVLFCSYLSTVFSTEWWPRSLVPRPSPQPAQLIATVCTVRDG